MKFSKQAVARIKSLVSRRSAPESDIALIVFNRKVRIAATPIMRINTLFNITVKRKKPPIGNLSYIAMFDRIEMQIIKMAGKIGLIADSIFPKAFLPKPEIAAD